MPIDDDVKKELATRDKRIDELTAKLDGETKARGDMSAQLGNFGTDLKAVTAALTKGAQGGSGTGGDPGSGGNPGAGGGPGPAKGGTPPEGSGRKTEFRFFPFPGEYEV